MKTIQIFLLICLHYVFAQKNATFTQRVDHFNIASSATFSQRYLVNDSYWDRESGPVFLLVGGEMDMYTWYQTYYAPNLD